MYFLKLLQVKKVLKNFKIEALKTFVDKCQKICFFLNCFISFTAVPETDSDHTDPSSRVKKTIAEKKELDSGRLSSSQEQIRFVVYLF